ncbi:S-adenosyl-L-methionine-dependent methyltransferase [Sordaria brevicollis]|uniref:tRNA (guanine(26)-N(2))-dimethyltransferase n=1 Tax=Sordaria brevicollis TaxID=83679 RepID=A0AAE0PI64_SORBR|nr:S-adenosyl-L-methionine-dependent methyltransferase [Sordaria brevicollis]
MRAFFAATSFRRIFTRLIRPTHQKILPLPNLRTMASEAKDITAPPADKQIIAHEGKRYVTVKEGLAHILVPEPSEEDKENLRPDQAVRQVFYNPIQQYNRDLTVLAIKAYGKEAVQQKQASHSKLEKIIEKKKRKRQAEKQDQQPNKAQKGADGEKATTETETVQQNGEEAKDATEQETDFPVEKSAEQATTNGETKKAKQPPFTVLDALSASGLRALRYAHEIPFLTSVTANDLLAPAVESIKLNVKHNRLEDKVNVSHDDALAHMYTLIAKELRAKDPKGKPVMSEKYDVVDLDPYGTAAPFLDAAVQSVRDDGGLLCVTCTDSGVWASNGYPEKCYSLYGGVPVKAWFSHEVGIRLVLYSIQTAAAKYGLTIEPLLSLSIDFYIRVFVRVKKSPAAVKFQGGKNMMVYNCDSGCGAWSTQLLMRNKASPNKKGSGVFYKHTFAQGPSVDKGCEHCGSTMHMAGPMYGGRIHSPDFIKRVLGELDEAPTDVYGTTLRIRGMLQTALEEILLTPEEQEAEKKKEEAVKAGKKADPALKELELAAIDPYPFYFHPATISGILKCSCPPEAPLKGALRGLGYRVTRSHCKPGSIKTDAPWSIIWHVFREWIRQKAPVKEDNIKPGTPGYRLLRLGEKKNQTEGAEAPKEQQSEEAEEQQMPKVVFDEQLGRDDKTVKLVRYQANPRENWGPLNRAVGKVPSHHRKD